MTYRTPTNADRLEQCRSQADQTVKLAIDVAQLMKLVGDEHDRESNPSALVKQRMLDAYRDLSMTLERLTDRLRTESFCLVTNFLETPMGPALDKPTPAAESEPAA